MLALEIRTAIAGLDMVAIGAEYRIYRASLPDDHQSRDNIGPVVVPARWMVD